jgi:ubiquinone/menaquinone biosynthesis C-methylase UbiE
MLAWPKRYSSLHPGGRLCGRPLHEQLLGIAGSVTAIELSATAIARARRRAPAARFVHTKLEDLPLPRVPYDLVVYGEMLHYVEDLSQVLHKG